MTKEEILEPCIQTHREVQIVELSDAIICMDEYAKQQAIAFGEWVDVNAVRNGFHNWTVGCGESKKEYTSEQLYNQFIEQQNKDNESNTSS